MRPNQLSPIFHLNSSILAVTLGLIGMTTSFVAVSAKIDTGKFYLGERKALMPQMIKAAELVSGQSSCIEITDGGYTEIIKAERTLHGPFFRFTCKVNDLPSTKYDNFYVDVYKLDDPGSIYRQQLRRTIREKDQVDANTTRGNCSSELVRTIQQFIVRGGLKCNSVSFCGVASKQDIRVTCNHDQYAYRIRDRGAGYEVHFD